MTDRTMTKALDVLVVESELRAADSAVAELEAAGHRVHRCHDEGTHGFACNGVADSGSCPIDDHIDVAWVVRSRVRPTPTALEYGVRCAIRAGIPIVEDGSETLDPFMPWIAARHQPGADIAATCTEVAHLAFEPLSRNITARIAALLVSNTINPDEVRCHIDALHHRLAVHLALPVPVERSIQHALAVRVLDAVRSSGRTFGEVGVHVHGPDAKLHSS